MTESLRHDVAGGWGLEGVIFTIGINSGASGIGLGISDRMHAMENGVRQTVSLGLSLTPDDADTIARALTEHAAAVRERITQRESEENA
jgi:hypothetical protein